MHLYDHSSIHASCIPLGGAMEAQKTLPETTSWTDEVEDVVTGDVNVALAYATPAKGVVILPVTNFATRDRRAATITVNTSVGAWKKLDRIRRDPNVALAF